MKYGWLHSQENCRSPQRLNTGTKECDYPCRIINIAPNYMHVSAHNGAQRSLKIFAVTISLVFPQTVLEVE
jgi:hypothetical protein